ncbi:hypothetical protein CJ179_36695 [Rhodococcus sp. ACS1]|uniref:enoyl-CoA hydratase/isomerase family protein n=1 Tax=Rhodococcus sp. ACS1 TaxID=2028570 RepID=UPI000BB15559|nr:enoyl-CoA hydratase/isomerase family protein [Rhodococcus sp. ACS1]PBC39551.1 hypothetical protein CJ179_36695 [Rhodococcus sp. ACS1]
MYTQINYTVSDRIAEIELAQPERMNAISPEMETEMHEALQRADIDPEVKVIVLSAAGNHFSSGYDIGTLDPERPEKMGIIDPVGETIEDYLTFWYRWDRQSVDNMMRLWRLDKPVIASTQGYVMGGGFWYQLACDLTVASEDAVFGQPEVRHISNTTFLFAALAGWKNANRYALTGDHFDAQEAYRMGLVNEVVPRSDLATATRELASRIAKVPLASLRLNKAITMAGLQASGVGSGMLLNGVLSGLAHSSHGPDRQELLEAQREGGLREFLRQRDGKFRPEPFGPKSK